MKGRLTKSGTINAVLWLAFILALVSSVSHLAWTFGTVEREEKWGWVAAIAVDSGLAALAYSIQQRKRVNRTTWILWVGVGCFAMISALANFYHALSAESGGVLDSTSLPSADWLLLAKAAILSATLPLMVLYLGEIVSSDDAAEAELIKAEAERERKKAEREAERAKAEAERLRMEQERAEAEAVKADGKIIQCPHCPRLFANQNALNAHMRTHEKTKQ